MICIYCALALIVPKSVLADRAGDEVPALNHPPPP